MNFHVENLWMLLGLGALAIPVVLHLLQRRHSETHHWGAMQFLPDSNAAQRKRWLDEILLMLVRMAMIALIVIALATPISTSGWLAALGDRTTRDVVVILDGSYSMDAHIPSQPTPWQEAMRLARERSGLPSPSGRGVGGEGITFLLARQPPHWLTDGVDARTSPRGNADMPGALAEAWKHLQRSKAAVKEIVVLTDGQRHGWADPATLASLESLGNQWHADAQQAKSDGLAIPSLRVVKVGPELPRVMPNFALAPLLASHGVVKVGQKVTFQSALHIDGFTDHALPRAVKAFVAGKEIKQLPLSATTDLKKGQMPLHFEHTFEKEGQHVVSLIVQIENRPSPPAPLPGGEGRPDANDTLAADNEQHLVVNVIKDLPVLLVHGDKATAPESSAFFLERAFSKRAIPFTGLKASALAGSDVIVLADVPRLEAAQIDAIDAFVANGGGLFVIAGERVATTKDFYNDRLYRNGDGWLPVKLSEVASSKDGARPDPRTFQHPALEIFRATPDGMNQVRFPRWWRVRIDASDRAMPIAMLANGEPMLIEKPYKKGRVILCCVPFDRRWGSTLPGAVEFPILAHELAYYLAGSRISATTLRQGAPLRLDGAPLQRVTLRTPESDEKMIDVGAWPWVYDNTGAIGVYRVQGSATRAWSFVVPPDLRESDLTRCSDDDWRKVRDRLPIAWHADSPDAMSLATETPQREELWWLFLLGVIGLLCMEVWMTRRLVKVRGR